MSSSSSGRSDRGQLLVLAALLLAIAYVGLTMIGQEVADTGFQATREETRSLVREYDNAKHRFGVALEHHVNAGNQSDAAAYLVRRGFGHLVGNYTELEASRRTHLDADLNYVAEAATTRQATANVTLTFEDEFTRVQETANFSVPVFLADGWWDSRWENRLPLVVDTRLLNRKNYTVEVDLNLTRQLERMGRPGSVDADSIQVVQVTASGSVVGSLTRGVRTLPGYDADDDARVRVVFRMDGTVLQRTERFFHIYFDSSVPEPPPSGVIAFADSFERASVNPEWDADPPSANGTDAGLARSGDRSWVADDGDEIRRDLVGDHRGVVSGWWHDPDPVSDRTEAMMRVETEVVESLSIPVGTIVPFRVGVNGTVNDGRNYTVQVDDEVTDTGVPRSEGWHRFTFVLNATRMDIYVDRKRVVTNETLGSYNLSAIELEQPDGNGDDPARFDDIYVYRDGTVSRVHPVHRIVRWPQWTR